MRRLPPLGSVHDHQHGSVAAAVSVVFGVVTTADPSYLSRGDGDDGG